MKVTLLEALLPHQRDEVSGWHAPHHSFSDHAFPESIHRAYIPLEHPQDSVHKTHVEEHLRKHGYEMHDYTQGTAKDKFGRLVKIGKALGKTGGDHLLKDFTEDPSRQQKSAASDSHAVVISRHPHDVAGMTSHGQSWLNQSCMRYGTGSNCHYLPKEVGEGTHVAYLIHKDDKNIENPLARIALKPHHATDLESGDLLEGDKKHTILRPETKTYGDAPDAFTYTVNRWVNKHFPGNPGVHAYKKSDEVYSDGSPHTILTDEGHNHVMSMPELGSHHARVAESTTNPDHIKKLHKMAMSVIDQMPRRRTLASGLRDANGVILGLALNRATDYDTLHAIAHTPSDYGYSGYAIPNPGPAGKKLLNDLKDESNLKKVSEVHGSPDSVMSAMVASPHFNSKHAQTMLNAYDSRSHRFLVRHPNKLSPTQRSDIARDRVESLKLDNRDFASKGILRDLVGGGSKEAIDHIMSMPRNAAIPESSDHYQDLVGFAAMHKHAEPHHFEQWLAGKPNEISVRNALNLSFDNPTANAKHLSEFMKPEYGINVNTTAFHHVHSDHSHVQTALDQIGSDPKSDRSDTLRREIFKKDFNKLTNEQHEHLIKTFPEHLAAEHFPLGNWARNYTGSVLDAAVNSHHKSIRGYVTSNPNLNIRHIDQLVNDSEPNVVTGLASHPKLPVYHYDKVIDVASKHTDSHYGDALMHIADRKDLHDSHAKKLTEAAINTGDIFRILHVGNNLFNNPSVSDEHRKTLLRDNMVTPEALMKHPKRQELQAFAHKELKNSLKIYGVNI